MSNHDAADLVEPYVPAGEVARRLGLPLPILLRRIEAGDVPAQRVEGPAGAEWRVRLSDLGVQPLALEDGSVTDDVADDVTDEAGDEQLDDAAEEPAAEQEAHEAEVEEPELPVEEEEETVAADEPANVETAVARVPETATELRAEVAGIRLDPRELVSGLLDRWERTLEQRIYAEQRQRFEGELNARQNLVKQLQLELQTARAEHAALQADRDRRMAELERRIWDLQRELDGAQETMARRRGIFRRG